ncbi:MAG: hypothetical protein ACJAYR_003039 [Sneathiella sp.]
MIGFAAYSNCRLACQALIFIFFQKKTKLPENCQIPADIFAEEGGINSARQETALLVHAVYFFICIVLA